MQGIHFLLSHIGKIAVSIPNVLISTVLTYY